MILYHYTTLETFKSIIDQIKDDKFILRGTQFEYLNDYTEINACIEQLYNKLLEYKKSTDKKKRKIEEFKIFITILI
jgi:hypothetical protein